jgi:hypothetical protein
MQRKIGTTHHCSYYAAFTEMIKILNIEILKYIKLITINPQRCNINSMIIIAYVSFRFVS